MASKKVLIVEDNIAIRMLLKNILQKEGYDVVEAENGAVGGAFLCSEDEFDLIFLDLMMPKLDGIGFLKKFSDFIGKTPVCVLSALGEYKNILEAISLGAEDYMVKPVDKDILLDKVAQLLSSDGGTFSKVKANFDVFFEGMMESFQAVFLSERCLTIELEEKPDLNKILVITGSFLNKIVGSEEGIISRINKISNYDGKYRVELQFVGIRESKRKRIRSLTVKGEEIHEAA